VSLKKGGLEVWWDVESDRRQQFYVSELIINAHVHKLLVRASATTPSLTSRRMGGETTVLMAVYSLYFGPGSPSFGISNTEGSCLSTYLSGGNRHAEYRLVAVFGQAKLSGNGNQL
jgi:hypothetical protein